MMRSSRWPRPLQGIQASIALLLASCAGPPAPNPAEPAADIGPSPTIVNRGEGKEEWWHALPRPGWSDLPQIEQSQPWFEVYETVPGVFALYEPGQFEEVISYLIVGDQRALLFDTGLGIGDMRRLAGELTDRPVTVLHSHTHYDHVGGSHAFDAVLAVDTAFTDENARGRPHGAVAEFVGEGWLWKETPEGFSPEGYLSRPFSITERISDGEILDLGGVRLEVLHTPGHAPDAICLLDRQRRLLWTGDTLYPATLYAHLPGSDVDQYEASAQRLAELIPAVDRLLTSHNEPFMAPQALSTLRDAFPAIREGTAEWVPSDGNREVQLEGFSILVPSSP